jgi:hypothetical protein
MQPQFQQLKLVEKSETVVNHRNLGSQAKETRQSCQVENKTLTFRRRPNRGDNWLPPRCPAKKAPRLVKAGGHVAAEFI